MKAAVREGYGPPDVVGPFSGQEDLQYTDPPQSAVHAQSWGQIQIPGLTRKETRDFLTSIGFDPGISCNPTSGFVLPE